ncbi:MAG TPA: DNA/RNA non-specific endonuclease [Anaerolineales bacterium]
MSDQPEARKKSRYGAEARYGMPAADQIIINRHYTIGYSYYFRQAKWALEIVDEDMIEVPRLDTFRPDYRIPQRFRTDLAIYQRSGYDRGHLVASANQGESQIQNSETFLLSNMSPQKAKFNRGIWKELEGAVRELNAKPDVLETYVICGPVFNFDIPVKTLRTKGDKGNTLPIPHAFYKSVLIEDSRGRFRMWSFLMANEEAKKPLKDFLVPTRKIERYSGLLLWEGLVGKEIDREKEKVRSMW